MASTKLGMPRGNNGKVFKHILAETLNKLGENGRYEQGANLALAIYYEQFKLCFNGERVTHPIDADELMLALGITRKDNIVRIIKSELEENADYIAFSEFNAGKDSIAPPNSGAIGSYRNTGGQNKLKYYLTTEAASVVAMNVRTQAGKDYRRFASAFLFKSLDYLHTELQTEKSKKRLTGAEKMLVRDSQHERVASALLQRAFSIVGWTMQAEIEFGSARADLGYRHFGRLKLYEVKKEIVTLETLAGKYAKFKANIRKEHLLFCKSYTVLAPAFTEEAEMFAEVDRHLFLVTFGELRDDLVARHTSKNAHGNTTFFANKLAELHDIFDQLQRTYAYALPAEDNAHCA